MDRLIGTLLVLVALAAVLPTVAALAQAALPTLIGLLAVLIAVRWLV